jgi:hypothetical protein
LVVGLLVVTSATARAADHYVYRATVSLLLQSATYENEVDQIVNLKLTSKSLVNAALGLPLKGKPPAGTIVVIAVPAAGPPFEGSRLGLLDTGTNAFTTLATVSSLDVLSPSDPKANSAGVGEAFFQGLPVSFDPTAELVLQSFTLAGGGTGKAVAGSDGPSLSLQLSGLHALVYQQGTPQPYASAITKGTIRVSGKPIATVDL